MNEALQLASIGVFADIGHARLEVPTRAMRVAESRPSGGRCVLGAGRAESDLAQQVGTRNERHRVFLEHLSEFVHKVWIPRGGADEQQAPTGVRLEAHRVSEVGRTLLRVRYRSICAISGTLAGSRPLPAIDFSP